MNIGWRAWWRHQMETFSALLAICAGNSPVPGEFPSQRPVTRSFDVIFDLRLNKRLSKQPWGWWFETPSRSLWRHCNGQKQNQSYLKCAGFHTVVLNEILSLPPARINPQSLTIDNHLRKVVWCCEIFTRNYCVLVKNTDGTALFRHFLTKSVEIVNS